MGPWLQELQNTVLRGTGKAHWHLMTQFVDLGKLFRHLRELLHNSVNFFRMLWGAHGTKALKFRVSTILLKFIKKKLKSRTSYLACSNSNIFSKVITRWKQSFVYLSVYSDKINFVLGKCLVCNVKCSLKDVYVFSVCKVFQRFWWCHKMYFMVCSYKSRLFKLLCKTL